MAVIKGKEKKLKKRIMPSKQNMSASAKKKLQRPQDCQPIPTVGGF
jgi:hypothetical protein